MKAGPPHTADIAVVLAGDSSGERILKAAELVRAGYAPQALVSGPAGMYGFYECDLAIPFAEKAGYPASYFRRAPNQAHSTQEEAAAMLAEVRAMGAHTILLVTSDYHTRRAGKIYRSLGRDLRFYVVASPDEDFTMERWWKSREGRKTLVIEWMKTVGEWLGL